MSDPRLTEWEDEPDTGIIEALIDSDPPLAEHLARKKLHAIAKRPPTGSFSATEPDTKPEGMKHSTATTAVPVDRLLLERSRRKD